VRSYSIANDFVRSISAVGRICLRLVDWDYLCPLLKLVLGVYRVASFKKAEQKGRWKVRNK
jgi:hypothetical protein